MTKAKRSTLAGSD